MSMSYDAMIQAADETLLALYAKGNPMAAQILTTRLSPMVFGYASRVLGQQDLAEDITQEAMLRLWKIAPKWRVGEAKISTWLYQVTANLCTDQLRKTRPMSLDVISDVKDTQPPVTAGLQNAARSSALQAALMNLPDRQRQAIILRHIEELSNPEIGNIMNISVEAVESLTARGKRALSVMLADQKDALSYATE
ncbi:RNA polymerase sigma factor [Sulfitobacter sp. 1151]|uniref:RNA polymerase sigma factor n=2 Tax=Parasulfitobacter algicola TaxID=2614809 RepID=A0ABX2INI2_9RHOB|nr:RNA polymerase sigma factor [Sulfitobacter algicola]NSX53915.1 RNA polymerase sigma factor [Sulfitobacter algicola]